jgi:hypothetical protein
MLMIVHFCGGFFLRKINIHFDMIVVVMKTFLGEIGTSELRDIVIALVI